MNIAELNRIGADEAREGFLRCCGCRDWAEAMTDARPYASLAEVHHHARATWEALPRAAWLEAFSAHPRIGDITSLRKKYENTKTWASGEQSGVNGAADEVLKALADGNAAYEARFGQIFIVCATGKSAADMLALLQARLGNDPDDEIRVAAGEQMKITALRIDKWLTEESREQQA